MKQFGLQLLAAALGVLMLASCSGDSSSKQKEKTQVAAVVNGVEITQRELDSIYKKLEAPGTPPKEAAAGRRALLGELVRIEALAQQAAADKLDVTPEYILEAHVAQRRLLATQVERAVAQNAGAVEVQAVRDFVAANPLIFADRQFFTLDSLAFTTPDPKLFAAVEDRVNKGATLPEIELMIRAANGGVLRQVVSLTSERLAAPVVARLTTVKPGTPVIIKHSDERGEVLAVRSATPAPLTGDAAMQAATSVIGAELKQRAVKERSQAILSTTRITYFGEFAPGASGATASDLPLGGNPIPLSKRRTAALMSAVAMAGILAGLLMVASKRYWQGGLLPANAEKAFARTVDGGYAHRPFDPANKASLAGKILLVLSWFACLGLLGALLVKGEQRLEPLPFYSMVALGAVLGAGAGYWFVHSPLRAVTRKARWAPVTLFSLLLAGACGAGIWIA